MECLYKVTDDDALYGKNFEEPWIAFKTLAAGAIHPEDGFRYAFENGADFICADMFDYELVEDANIVVDLLNSDVLSCRKRRWLA